MPWRVLTFLFVLAGLNGFMTFPKRLWQTKDIKKGHFTVVCLVPWPLNRSEAGGDLAMLKTSLLSCANRVILMLNTSRDIARNHAFI